MKSTYLYSLVIVFCSISNEANTKEIIYSTSFGGKGEGKDRAVVVYGPSQLNVNRQNYIEIYFGEYVREDGSIYTGPSDSEPIQDVIGCLIVPEDKVTVNYKEIQIHVLKFSGKTKLRDNKPSSISSFDQYLELFSLSDLETASDYTEKALSIGGSLFIPGKFTIIGSISNLAGGKIMESVFGSDEAMKKVNAFDLNYFDIVPVIWTNTSTLNLGIINEVKITIPFKLDSKLSKDDKISMYGQLRNEYNSFVAFFSSGFHTPDMSVFSTIYPRSTPVKKSEKETDLIFKVSPDYVAYGQDISLNLEIEERSGKTIELTELITEHRDREGNVTARGEIQTSDIDLSFGSSKLNPFGKLSSINPRKWNQQPGLVTFSLKGINDAGEIVKANAGLYSISSDATEIRVFASLLDPLPEKSFQIEVKILNKNRVVRSNALKGDQGYLIGFNRLWHENFNNSNDYTISLVASTLNKSKSKIKLEVFSVFSNKLHKSYYTETIEPGEEIKFKPIFP